MKSLLLLPLAPIKYLVATPLVITALTMTITLIGPTCILVDSLKEPIPLEEAARNGSFKNIEGKKVHYIVKGRGEAVILIHGLGDSYHSWRFNIDSLSRHFKVCALDLKGFGFSEKPKDEDYSIKGFAHFVAKFMDALGIEKAFVIGHSMGGAIALELALDFPERVKKLVLVDNVGYRPKGSILFGIIFYMAKLPAIGETLIAPQWKFLIKNRVGSAYYDKIFVTDERIEEFKKARSTEGGKRGLLSTIRAMNFSVGHRIKHITQPTLIVWGKEDKLISVDMASRYKKDIKNSRVKIFPQCGHNPHEEKAQEFNQLVIDFLKEPLK